MLSKTPFEVPAYLLDKAKGLSRNRMAIAGADNKIVLESARLAAEAGLIEPLLVGDADIIRSLSKTIGWDLGDTGIIHAEDEAGACAVSVALAASSQVGAIMKGHVHTEAIMRAALKREAGLRGERRASHVFHMTIPGRDRVLLITAASINIAPDVDTLMDIVKNAVDIAHALGNTDPKVAMLSGAETVNPSMPSSVRAADVVKRANNRKITGCIVDGPFAFDLAVSPEAARIKGIDSPVAGQADIVVVPNIETGNGLFKMMVYFMSALAAGVVVGTKVPIVLTSRADPPEARFAATLIAAIIAHGDGTQNAV